MNTFFRIALVVSTTAGLLLSGSALASTLEAAASATSTVAAKKAKKAKTAKKKAKRAKNSPKKKFKVAPLKKNIKWSHAPYEMGECSICHEKDDPKNPGKVKGDANELCLSCHEQIGEIMAQRKFVHGAAKQDCGLCHNPHNSSQRMLLHVDYTSMCANCHQDIGDLATKSKVKHDAVYKDKACGNCHNPHATEVENLLIQLPFDLCVNCHGKDGMKDDAGREMTNFVKLLKENPVHHAPVEGKDCSACHQPHGGPNFRLLTDAYPEKFYAPYDPDNYALCYNCHNDQIMAKPETTTLTGFRDGKRNMHYLHVHKEDRGRTCRACHEVHASVQPHQIRDGVPYGKSGWVLKINYEQTAKGGNCAKTCHTAKSYKNKR